MNFTKFKINISTIILSTTNSIPGREISVISGIVRRSNVRARNVGCDFVAALKNITGVKSRSTPGSGQMQVNIAYDHTCSAGSGVFALSSN
ncbi:MAG: heavy metal-binding domain-containing protein [Bacteroidales bacterium]